MSDIRFDIALGICFITVWGWLEFLLMFKGSSFVSCTVVNVLYYFKMNIKEVSNFHVCFNRSRQSITVKYPYKSGPDMFLNIPSPSSLYNPMFSLEITFGKVNMYLLTHIFLPHPSSPLIDQNFRQRPF